MLFWAGWFLFWAVALAALPLQLLGLPGTWILLADALALRLLGGGERMALGTLLALLLVALAGEFLELWFSVEGSRSGKTAHGTSIAALAGALLGGLAGAPLMFGLGAIPGMAAGALAGAFLLNLARGRSASESLTAGVGAMRGRLKGTAVKMLAALAMFATIVLTVTGG